MKDLHELPKVRDSWSHLYIEHAKVDREDMAIVIHDARGRVSVPCASLSFLMLGPGTSITHAAVTALAENGCLAIWCGEQGVRFYAEGLGETRDSANFLHQARVWANQALHHEVVLRMYRFRFGEVLDPNLTLRQIRGKEGARVREAYAQASREYGVTWSGRAYRRDQWDEATPINRALSAANSCLYGLCHAAIVAAGFSPALGFVHTGKMLSFVYDVADLYKTEVTIPVAFKEAAQGANNLESRVPRSCRDQFTSTRLLARIIPDLQKLLDFPDVPTITDYDSDGAAPGGLWDGEGRTVAGGTNFSSEDDAE